MKVKIYGRPKRSKIYSLLAIQRQQIKVSKLCKTYNEAYIIFMKANAKLSDMRNTRASLELALISTREATGRLYR